MLKTDQSRQQLITITIMKHASTVLTILITVLIFSCTEFSKTEYSTEDTKAYLKVTTNTTESELKIISAELKQKRNIDVDYSQSKFFDNGRIKNLVLKVNTNDGFSGEASCSSDALKMKHFGFVRDYSKEAIHPFVTGTL